MRNKRLLLILRTHERLNSSDTDAHKHHHSL